MHIYNNFDDSELVTMLRAGAVGVLPTDTLYGLVACADNPSAVKRLYALKHREQKPGTSIAATTAQLLDLGLPEDIIKQVAHLWPNPVSVVIPHTLEYIHQGRGDSPFRVVSEGPLKRLLLQTGPLVTSSANHPGEPPATNVIAAQDYFGNSVDFYVDGGELGERPPSTVVGVTEEGIKVFRAGAVTINEKGEII